jgi:hypothetical protein
MKFVACAIVGVFVSPVFGQSFNFGIGQPGTAPSSTYAAAGKPGLWLSLPGTQGVTVFNLVDVNGTVTGVSMNQIGGTQTLQVSDPALGRDDATLMNDFLITHTTIENCLFFSQMQPGNYEVLIYARMPAQSGVMAKTKVDQEPGVPTQLVGGEWPGYHVENISYSKHVAIVAASGAQAGKLGLHSGVAPGGSFAIGAALNAVQIRKLMPGDATDNGTVDVDDLLAVINAWGDCPAPPGTCFADIAPLGGNGVINVDDLLAVINNWG